MPDTAPRTGTTTSRLNLREGPGTSFAVKTVLPVKTKLLILAEEGDWYKVSANGQEGYANKGFVLLETQKVMNGFLIDLPQAAEWPLPPAVPLAAPAGGGANATAVARIWNKFGGLLEPLAARIGIDPEVAVAVVAAESGGSGFKNGRMIIRFENHHFWRLWGKNNPKTFNTYFRFNESKSWTGHQFRPSTGKPWMNFHGNQDAEWMVFTKAQSLDDNAAKSSISMGLPQILGSNCALIGYDTPSEMFTAFSNDERTQLIGLFDFIQGPHNVSRRVTALQHKDFVAFAAQYNGSGQAAKYGAIIQAYVKAFGTLKPA